MTGHCSYWLINLISVDPINYLSNGTSNQVEQIKTSLVKITNEILIK
jgi:hypothetical protein